MGGQAESAQGAVPAAARGPRPAQLPSRGQRRPKREQPLLRPAHPHAQRPNPLIPARGQQAAVRRLRSLVCTGPSPEIWAPVRNVRWALKIFYKNIFNRTLFFIKLIQVSLFRSISNINTLKI